MKKIILLISLFLAISLNTFAYSEIKDKYFNYYWNQEFYIPQWVDILEHYLRFDETHNYNDIYINSSDYGSENSIDFNVEDKPELLNKFISKIWEVKVENFLSNWTLWIIKHPYRFYDFWNSEDYLFHTTEITQKLYINNVSEGNNIIKWYPINPEIVTSYPINPWIQSYDMVEGTYEDMPKILIFDNLLLPQGLKVLSTNFEGHLSANITKVYEKYETKKLYYKDNYTYVLVPYFEIELPSNSSNPENIILSLSYQLFENDTTITITKDWNKVSSVEYIKY